MESHNFGIEIELTGISRRQASELIGSYFGSTVEQTSEVRSKIEDKQGRVWYITNDRSIRPQTSRGNEESLTEDELNTYRVELITPILDYSELNILGDIINMFKLNGAFVNNTCGIHIHLDMNRHNVVSLKRLINLFHANTAVLYKALGIYTNRLKYCRKLSNSIVKRVNSHSELELELLKEDWYGDYPLDRRDRKKNRTRYHGLNLHSAFHCNNIEIRLFNATLDIKEIIAYAELCVVLSEFSLSDLDIPVVKDTITNTIEDFKFWLEEIGLCGEKYSLSRDILSSGLIDVASTKYTDSILEDVM